MRGVKTSGSSREAAIARGGGRQGAYTPTAVTIARSVHAVARPTPPMTCLSLNRVASVDIKLFSLNKFQTADRTMNTREAHAPQFPPSRV